MAGGGGRLWPWRRRCRLGEGASGGEGGCGGGELRAGPIYKRGEAVERGGGRPASSAAINGAWTRRGVAERRRDSRQQYRRRDGSAEAERRAGHPAARGARGGTGMRVQRIAAACCAWWCCASRESWDDKEASLADLHAEWSSTHAVAMANNLLVVVSCLCASTQRGDEERARDWREESWILRECITEENRIAMVA